MQEKALDALIAFLRAADSDAARSVCFFSISFVLVCLLVKLRNLDWYLVMLKVCQGSMRCNCGEMPHRKDEDSGESSGGIHALDRIGGSRPVFGAFSLSLSLSL